MIVVKKMPILEVFSKPLLAALLLLAGASAVFCQKAKPTEWQKIVPLVTTCKDMKRYFSVKECPEIALYEFEDVIISVAYSKPGGELKLKEITVVGAQIVFRDEISPEELITDKKSYKEYRVAKGAVTLFINDKKGIRYTVIKDRGKLWVNDVILFPPNTNQKGAKFGFSIPKVT